MSDGDRPVVHPSDAALADLKLAMRGVRLAVDALGGTELDVPAAPAGTARIVVPADVAQRAVADGGLMVADEEGHPLATLVDLSVGLGADGGALVSGRVVATRPAEWSLPAAGGGEAVVALRPLLPADVDRLTQRRVRVVLVPHGGPSPDGIPGPVLLAAVEAALTGTQVAVTGVELAPPPGAALPARWRAVQEAVDAATLTLLSAADVGWRAGLVSLDGPDAERDHLPPEVAAVLRRWRRPRARRGLVVFFTGLSGSGKSTLARALTRRLEERGRTVSLLDGDVVRRLLSSGLGFDRGARDLNVRRIAFVAAEVARHGGIAVCAPIAPYAESRAAARAMARAVGDFVLVHVSTPLEECERRDVKGLYARARAGQLEHFTGVTDPYEQPTDADVTVDTSELSELEALSRVLGFLEDGGWIPPVPRS